jgi:hypothetical protein
MYYVRMNHRTIISFWPDPEALAQDLRLPKNTVIGWRWRNSIPPRHWTNLVLAARKRSFVGVTFETLANAISRRKAAA